MPRSSSKVNRSPVVEVFPVRLGAGVPEPFSDELRSFYRWLASELLVTPDTSESLDAKLRSDLIPCVTLEDLADHPSLIADELRRFLDGVAKDEEPTLVIVHFHADPSLVIPPASESALLHAVRETALKKSFPLARFLVLRRELPPDGDIFRLTLKDVVSQGKVIVFAENGESWPALEPNMGPDPAEYKFRSRKIRPGHRTGISERVCRIRGHFRRLIHGQELCTRYLYDASRAIPEISRNITEKFGSYLKDTDLIIVDAKVSNWLQDIAALIAEPNGTATATLSSVLEQKILPEASSVGRSLLLLPVVDSGNTLEENLRRLEDIFGNSPACVLAVIVTSNWPALANEEQRISPVEEGGLTVLKWRNRELPVHYLLKVERGLEASTNCELCRSRLLEVQQIAPSSHALTSFAFWEMAVEAGFKPVEDDAPDWRLPLPGAPNIPEMLGGADGIWLASIALETMESQAWKQVDTNALLLVAPDQPGARLFAARISDLASSCQVVLLPDSVVKRFRNDPQATMLPEERDSVWGRRLRAASPGSRPIVCEEFSVSGGTASGITRLLASVGKPAAAHLMVVDLQPSKKAGEGDPKRLSIYQFDFESVMPAAEVLYRQQAAKS